MQRFLHLTGILVLLITVASCSSTPDEPWIKAVPASTPVMILPAPGSTFQSVLNAEYTPFIDDITTSAMHLVNKVSEGAGTSVGVKAMLLYPSTSNTWQPVWVTEAPADFIATISKEYDKKFTQGQYYFDGQTIHKLYIQDHIIYAVQMRRWLIVSENSLGVEEAVRTYLGKEPAIEMKPGQLSPSRLVINTPHLDNWVNELAQVAYRPNIDSAFTGTLPAVLNVKSFSDDQNKALRISGNIPLKEQGKSPLVAALTQGNSELTLDRYISSNAAAFGIFRRPAVSVLPKKMENPTPLDSVLLERPDLYRDLAKPVASEFAMEMFAESGFLSVGEHLFIRRLSDYNAFYAALGKLADEDLVDRQGNTWYIESKLIARLIGSDLCSFDAFYLGRTRNGVVISKRKGLTESVESDRSRRRVIFYEDNYRRIKKDFPDQISGLVVANSERFKDFIKPYLSPDNYMSALTSKFDYLAMTFSTQPDAQQTAFDLTTYKKEESSLPYRERWLFPTNGSELTGQSVLSDIGGSSRDEVIFSTTGNRVYALATDGTVVLQTSTGSDRPIGSPVIYDWYGNNQDVILLAAGNKIYGWNTAGNSLPKFPMEMEENITAPLRVADVTRNGIPELIVATADRKVHLLDGRGQDIQGWPRTTNTVVKTAPLFANIDRRWSIFAFSENTLHAWNADGQIRTGFPKFINASFTGSPTVAENHILGNAADGRLYAFGRQQMFSDSLNVYQNMPGSSDEIKTEAIYAANASMNGSPTVKDLTITEGEQAVNGTFILTLSENGSVFLFNKKGALKFTASMGQPSAPGFSPFVANVHNDGSQEILSLADYGRLYAWDARTGERSYSSLPTTSMTYPVIVDLDGDGNRELIAQTREGVRCWTIIK